MAGRWLLPDRAAASTPPGPQTHAAHRRAGLRREWLVLALAVLAIVTWLSSSGALRRVDHLLHDAGMRRHALPPSGDIALIAIDDESIEAVGRWPWRRALHAQALSLIAAQGPRAIGLDVLLGEPDDDYPGDDLLLARALDRAGNVVLPVARRGLHSHGGGSADAPLPLLRSAAAQIGHVQVEVDGDGVVRRLYAREGPRDSPWPHMSIALLCAAGQAQPACRGNRTAAGGPWTQQDPQILAFTSGRPPFATYSYVDVLKGRLPAGALRGKYVLVGATAIGLGDMFAAPMTQGAARIPGVELLGHALHAELSQGYLRPAPAAAELALHLALTALALLAMALLGPAAGLAASALLAAAALAVAVLLPPLTGWQPAVAPALAGIALAWPLWSWRRLSAAAHFLQLEMRALQQQVPLPAAPHRVAGDALERRIHAVEDASARLRRLHHFISASLQHLPSPTLVCDGDGRVLLANEAAERHFAQARGPLAGQSASTLLSDLVAPQQGGALLPPGAFAHGGPAAQQEGRDGLGRSILMLCQRHALDGRPLWLLTLVDLTAMRRAQQQRDQALHFISHDIRAPASSIITLLEMQRAFPGRMEPAQLLERIERHAQASLAMAQGFVRLASAQADTYQSAAIDLVEVLERALDDAWAAAQDKGLALVLDCPLEQAPFVGDRALLLRAVANVLGNAIKFSPGGACVRGGLALAPGFWVIAVEDEGPGIASEQHAHLFEPFRQLPMPGDTQGVGLGLAFVRTVVERHGGRVAVHSSEGAGARFELWLPCLQQVAPASAAAPGRPEK